MRRQLALAAPLALLVSTLLALAPSPAPAQVQDNGGQVVGPSRIFYMDADTVMALVTKDWQSAAVRHQEKLLRTSLRLKYWRDRLPGDMRRVFDALGYPTGRVFAMPAGHFEEWWYYGPTAAPLRFREGALVDTDRFEAILRAMR